MKKIDNNSTYNLCLIRNMIVNNQRLIALELIFIAPLRTFRLLIPNDTFLKIFEVIDRPYCLYYRAYYSSKPIFI
jgi:hypothetical protein